VGSPVGSSAIGYARHSPFVERATASIFVLVRRCAVVRIPFLWVFLEGIRVTGQGRYHSFLPRYLALAMPVCRSDSAISLQTRPGFSEIAQSLRNVCHRGS
jgi:hypothetical protein